MTIAACVIAIPTAGASATGSLRLASQSAYVNAPGTFSIAVNVTSALPMSALGLEFSLYSHLSTRQAFALSTTNAEFPSQSCLDQTSVLPLPSLVGGATGVAVRTTFAVQGIATQPSCATATNAFSLEGCASGSCDGVYPLAVALIERSTGRVIRSFTTHVVVATRRQASKDLQVGLVIPLGGTPSFGPDGSPALGRSLPRLTEVVRALRASRSRLSVSLSPDLLLALKGTSGTAALTSSIDALVSHGRPGARVEILTTPYADVDASALVASGLGADAKTAVATGRSALAAHFGQPLAPAPYVSSTPMTSAGLAALQGACLNEFVLPQRSILASFRLTPTAPLLVGKPALCGTSLKPPVAFVADASLSAEISAKTNDPVLAGENVLADLAQVYFEGPFDPDPRAVVVVGSPSLNPRVLEVVLAGLGSNPILQTSQLTNLFTTVPPGSNQNLTVGQLGGSLSGDAPSVGHVRSAKATLSAVKATMPNNKGLIRGLNDSILTAESARMSAS
ncbi:MAG TPA: hypothetical protein VG368_05375, partial [Acidimicrobiales bacterium]|nr:hypothetical protein [Acidimicrobiales bacterium]